MADYLALFVKSGMLSEVHTKYVAGQLISLNSYTEQHGIVLSQADCKDIAECRSDLLVKTERIEIGLGAVKRIIERFCDSGYVDQRTFAGVVEELLECFYAIKNETDDKASDDEVLAFLEIAFETTGGDVSKIYMLPQFEIFIRKANGTYVNPDDRK